MQQMNKINSVIQYFQIASSVVTYHSVMFCHFFTSSWTFFIHFFDEQILCTFLYVCFANYFPDKHFSTQKNSN